MIGRAIALALALGPAALAAPARLTEPAIRAFVTRQEAAWNAGNLPAYAATFATDARFVDQARGSDNKIVPYGVSTLPQAMAQARRFFATSHVHETATVDRIEIDATGRAARVLSHIASRIEAPGKPPRTLCAEREQTLALAAGGVRSRGQTDTAVRCPH